jgi:hypothetical protein
VLQNCYRHWSSKIPDPKHKIAEIWEFRDCEIMGLGHDNLQTSLNGEFLNYPIP